MFESVIQKVKSWLSRALLGSGKEKGEKDGCSRGKGCHFVGWGLYLKLSAKSRVALTFHGGLSRQYEMCASSPLLPPPP